MSFVEFWRRHAHVLTDWEPHERIFAPTKETVDPRLFDVATRQMLPQVRQAVLGKLDAHFAEFPEWRRWAKVYLAGSEASLWYGNNDFDILVGVDYDTFRSTEEEDLSNDEITRLLNDDFKTRFNNEEWRPAFDPDEDWHLTGYVNKDSYDIRKIKPYAAYDVTADEWAVHPVEEPTGHHFTESEWYYFEGVAEQVRVALDLTEPERTTQLRALYDWLHSDRSRAFGPHGTGVYDRGNAVEKYLDQAGLWEPLAKAKWGKTSAKGGPCSCCDGKGEHDTGRECYRCDASGQEKWAEGQAPCDGTKPYGMDSEGHQVELDPMDGWQHLDGSISHDDGSSITDRHVTRLAEVRRPKEGPNGEEPEGIMIALVPPLRHVEPLLPEDGEHPSNLHVTLAYLGDMDEHSEEQIDALPELIEAWAEGQKTIDGHIQGVGTFVNEDSHVLWAGADLPGAARMYVSLIDYLKEHGYKPRENHGFVPHITLAYGTTHFRFLPKLHERKPWPVREVWLCIGPRWESFPLGRR